MFIISYVSTYYNTSPYTGLGIRELCITRDSGKLENLVISDCLSLSH